MITSTASFGAHVIGVSFKLLGPVRQVLNTVFRSYTMAPNSKINFDTKHLKQGDPLPPFTGKLRVYNMRYCPFAQRTILALNAKGIDYEVVNVNLQSKPDWLFVKSPFGKVPSVEIKENVVVYESLVTVEYLDEIYPERPLLPKDPLLKAYDKIIIESASGLTSLFYKALRSPESINEEVKANYHKSLKFIEDELVKRGTKFLDGSLPGYGDYMIWPWIEKSTLIADFFPVLKLDEQKYQRLDQYIKDMFLDPAVHQYLVPKEVLIKFLEGYKTGTINYDILHDYPSQL